MRAFRLVRDTDVSGISGTGVVAEGVEFSSGVVALTWLSEWPTSVVFHDRGMDSVEAIHGHGGATRVAFQPERTPEIKRLALAAMRAARWVDDGPLVSGCVKDSGEAVRQEVLEAVRAFKREASA